MEGEKSENIKSRNDQLLHEHMFEAYEENVCCYTNACTEDKKQRNQVLHDLNTVGSYFQVQSGNQACIAILLFGLNLLCTLEASVLQPKWYKFQGAVGQVMHLTLSQKLNFILQW